MTKGDTVNMLLTEKRELMSEVEKMVPDWAPRNKFALAGLRGSDAHGTKLDDKGPNDIDDLDVFVIVVQPIEWYLGLNSSGKQRQHWDSAGQDIDILVYDFRKFMGLAAKSNPNVLNWLFNRPEDNLLVDTAGVRLLQARELFITQEAFPGLVGYAYAQLKKMNSSDKKYEGYMGEKRKRLVDEFGYDLKNAAHCVRLLSSGLQLAREGIWASYRPADERKLIMDVKRGLYTLNEITIMAEDLLSDLKVAMNHTNLPEKIDRDAVSKLTSDIIIEVDNSPFMCKCKF